MQFYVIVCVCVCVCVCVYLKHYLQLAMKMFKTGERKLCNSDIFVILYPVNDELKCLSILRFVPKLVKLQQLTCHPLYFNINAYPTPERYFQRKWAHNIGKISGTANSKYSTFK